jgi:hypothetical protein
MAYVYDNQRDCGDLIKKAFDQEGFPYVLLLAQMQMGKSGTYWYVIFNMLFDKANNIDNIIVISGNRERDLHSQVKNDFKAYTKWYVDNCGETDAKIIRSMKNKCKNSVSILWGTHLSSRKTKTPIPEVKDNTLIVWDESHYAQSKKNTPDLFFSRNNLDKLVNNNIECEDIKKRNIKLLNVSATPFSELIAHSNGEHTMRKVVRLIPSDRYCGVEKYISNGLIETSFTINADTYSNLLELLESFMDENNPKYAIVRVSNNAESCHVQQACDELNIDCKMYNSEKKEIEMEDLKEEPTTPTVIVISGMLRMGKVIPKDYICMVFETCTKNNTKKTDTCLQGLLGRMCGYATDEHGFDIKIYVEECMVNELSLFVEGYSYECGPMNTSAMNVIKPKRKHSNPNDNDSTIHVIKLACNESYETKTGKVDLKLLQSDSWLDDVLRNQGIPGYTLDNTEYVHDFIISNKAHMKCKDLNATCNKTLHDILKTGCAVVPSHMLKPNTCYVCKEQKIGCTVMWIVTNIVTIYNAPQTDIPNKYEIDVRDKCIFKGSPIDPHVY